MEEVADGSGRSLKMNRIRYPRLASWRGSNDLCSVAWTPKGEPIPIVLVGPDEGDGIDWSKIGMRT